MVTGPGASISKGGFAQMRVMLFTGKGGVGKTTLAAGTAALAARDGEPDPCAFH